MPKRGKNVLPYGGKQEFEIRFEWTKAESGYIWEDCEASKELWCAGNDDILPPPPYMTRKDPSQAVSFFPPLADSTLFARFGDLVPSQKNFLKWAQEYGPLLNGEVYVRNKIARSLFVFSNSVNPLTAYSGGGLVTLPRENGGTGNACPAESLRFWYGAHRVISVAVMLLEFLDQKNIEQLEKIIWISPDKSRVLLFPLNRHQLGAIDIDKMRHDETYQKEHNILCQVYFDKERNINAWRGDFLTYLDELSIARDILVDWILEHLERYPLRVAVGMERKIAYISRIPYVNYISPSSLLSALWWQINLAVQGKIRLRRCDLCDRWEDMSSHRSTWRRHASCASMERTMRYRAKKME
jgi:hypothetical protein